MTETINKYFSSRRFDPEQTRNSEWIKSRSQESYARNYYIVFPNDERLAGRNFQKGPFHEVCLSFCGNCRTTVLFLGMYESAESNFQLYHVCLSVSQPVCLFCLSVLNNLDPTGQTLSSQTRETLLCEVHAGANKRNAWRIPYCLLRYR